MTPYATYVAEAGQRDFVVPFPFLNRSHVKARANGVLQSLAPWPGPNTVRMLAGIPGGSFVELLRDTPLDGPLVEFQNGAVLTSEDLNTAVLQLLYRQQELVALYDRTLKNAQVRLADLGGVPVDADDVFDTLVQQILGSSVLEHLQSRLGELDQNAAAILIETNTRIAELAEARTAINARVDGLIAGLVSDNDEAFAEVRNDIATLLTETESIASQLEAVLAGTGDGDAAAIIVERNARVAADAALASEIEAVVATVGDANARITSEETARASEDEALAQAIQNVEASAAGNSAAISYWDRTLVDQLDSLAESLLTTTVSFGDAKAQFVQDIRLNASAIAAEASRVTALTAQVGQAQAAIVSEQTARAAADGLFATQLDAVRLTAEGAAALVGTERDARIDADGALASRLDAVEATAGSASAAVIAETAARISADEAVATALGAVTTTLNGHTASITSQQTSLNGLQLQYGVKLNSNGHVTGFVQNNNGVSGDFTVVADVFKVSMPGGTAFSVFTVTSDGVRIDGNLIVTGSITGTKIADNTVGTPQLTPNAVTNITIAGDYIPPGDEAPSVAQGDPIVVATLTTSGGVVMINGYSRGTFTGGVDIGLRNYSLQRNGINILPIRRLSDVNVVMHVDVPPPGTHTYSVVNNRGTMRVSDKSLLLLEIKA